jgi:hypothetical protein
MTCGENLIPAIFAPPALLGLIAVFAVNIGTLTFGWLLLNDIVHRNRMASEMGFTRRKLDDQRRETAEKRKRPVGVRPMPKCLRMLSAAHRCLERAPGSAKADVVLSDNRRGHCSAVLVPVDMLSSLPDHQCNRPANARPSSRSGSNQPHSRTVLPLVSPKRTFRRARATIANEHR